jgi:hypothetical protein
MAWSMSDLIKNDLYNPTSSDVPHTLTYACGQREMMDMFGEKLLTFVLYVEFSEQVGKKIIVDWLNKYGRKTPRQDGRS